MCMFHPLNNRGTPTSVLHDPDNPISCMLNYDIDNLLQNPLTLDTDELRVWDRAFVLARTLGWMFVSGDYTEEETKTILDHVYNSKHPVGIKGKVPLFYETYEEFIEPLFLFIEFAMYFKPELYSPKHLNLLNAEYIELENYKIIRCTDKPMYGFSKARILAK